MRFAVGIPNAGEFGDPAVIAELGREAEAAGWDGVFVWDHLARREGVWPCADPWVALAALAATTERVKLGVMVTPLSRRRPQVVARQCQSLQQLSGGRFVFGAGLGSAPEVEFIPFGDEGDARVRAELLDEGLEVLRGLWSGEPFSFAGRHLRVEGAQFVPRVEIPIWIAGRWPARRPFRRAARFDGVFPLHDEAGPVEPMSPEQLAEIVDYVRAHRADPEAPFDVVIEGASEPGQDVSAWGEAGLTWWNERLSWHRGPLSEARERLRAGPPRA
ncbi:MAG: LLM class flavin-dependent oxidoreductase [Thermoleophilaceae bacterium]|nr:LLM class flavin-dependent oxidoreductase [Thermoleophilaceae bacterium]